MRTVDVTTIPIESLLTVAGIPPGTDVFDIEWKNDQIIIDHAPDGNGDAGLPQYLQEVVEEAREYLEDSGVTETEAAMEIASTRTDLTSSLGSATSFGASKNRRDNLEVLKDIRNHDCLCTDELDTYRKQNADPHEATIDAIVRRSLEELIYCGLSQNRPPKTA